MLKLSHVIFYVQNVKHCLAFYEKVFHMQIQFLHESEAYAEMSTGTVVIAFASEELGSMNLPNGYYQNNIKQLPAGVEITFTTDNVITLFDKALQEGAYAVSSPKEKPWGQTVAYIRDPQGILIAIASPIL